MKQDDPEMYAKYQSLMDASKANPMSDSAARGRELFFSDAVGCTSCHVGANLADET